MKPSIIFSELKVVDNKLVAFDENRNEIAVTLIPAKVIKRETIKQPYKKGKIIFLPYLIGESLYSSDVECRFTTIALYVPIQLNDNIIEEKFYSFLLFSEKIFDFPEVKIFDKMKQLISKRNVLTILENTSVAEYEDVKKQYLDAADALTAIDGVNRTSFKTHFYNKEKWEQSRAALNQELMPMHYASPILLKKLMYKYSQHRIMDVTYETNEFGLTPEGDFVFTLLNMLKGQTND